MGPKDNPSEHKWRLQEHARAIVHGTGLNGIRNADLAALLGIGDVDNPDDVYCSTRAVEAG